MRLGFSTLAQLCNSTLRVHRVDGEQVAVRAVAGRRVRAVVALDAAVAGEHHSANAEVVLRARAGGQLGDVSRDVERGPVPEPGGGRRVRVEAGHSVRLGALRGAGPGQLRASGIVAGQRVGEALAVDDVLGRDVEGRHVRQRGVRVGAGETVGNIICSHVPIPTGELVTAATPRSEQLRVSPVGGDEFGVGAVLDDAPGVHDQDPVRGRRLV